MSFEKLNQVYKIFKKKYKELNKIPLIITPKNNNFDYEGMCHYDSTEKYIYLKKGRMCKLIPTSIEIIENNDMIFTLMHEITHTLSYHYELRDGENYIPMDHSHLFYEKFLEITTYAYEKKIITKQYDLKKLKLVDGCMERFVK